MPAHPPSLVDNFGRQVTYLRMSVTDRCDFRCVYCMSEEMTFLPRSQILSLEEMAQVGRAFVELGVTKIRLTGGEPLVRRGVMQLFRTLGALDGLEELVLTTNGSQLPRYAQELRDAGVRRLNISLDSLRPDRFRRITRTGRLEKVLEGIEAAVAAGFDRIKLNTVAMKGRNSDEIVPIVDYAVERGIDVSFIEEMPLGAVDGRDRGEGFMSSDEVRGIIETAHTLRPTPETTGGPSRYFRIPGSETRIGFISPHSHNFCESCNRVRVTVEGLLLLCLGQEHSKDLRAVLRESPGDQEALRRAIADSMATKPRGHDFNAQRMDRPAVLRHMNVTGG